ncbi:DUF4177 domain-containing protein [Sinisalibacter aestuarii]|uniref:Cell division protein FtsZ n=1 Tax=Sinisalibacter aestuarii TaxID=2949426 RepID=A0ABQ5LU87_9RHOB|nr:DUF4177 domain-containing protein [Sinisalibacter aestuarii]GKY88547.1 cell division protein FtsZ [Sinisalibacter aestuarii]
MTFEYKVVPAPTRGKKAKGVKTAADRFARALAETINAEAAEGWEYIRTDTLPAEERQGLTGRTTVFQNMLIFRRDGEAVEAEPRQEISVVTDITETHAPKLPSADTAQAVPEPSAKAKLNGAEKRDVAAE